MTDFQADIISLIYSAITGEKVMVSESFDWELARRYGNKHKISPLLFYGAYNSGLKIPEDTETALMLLTSRHLLLSEKQLLEVERLKEIFDGNGIDYVILKGSVLKQMYPRPEMRPMGDIDILIRVEQYVDVKLHMQSLGYVEDKESDHELVWVRPGLMVELHKKLIPSYNKDFYQYFDDGWKFVKKRGLGKCEYTFTPEDQFVYLFTHFAKHYRDAGIGVLHLIDLYVFSVANPEMDKEYIYGELKKLSLHIFYRNVLCVLEVCFGKGEIDAVSDTIIQRIFHSGSYGNATTQALSTAVKKTKNIKDKRFTRLILFLKRVFMSYPDMCKRHPILVKAPPLLPVFWIYRILSVVFLRKDTIKKELRYMKVSSAEQVENYYNELQQVGLSFDFNE